MTSKTIESESACTTNNLSLNQTFAAYHSKPPHDFRDSSSNGSEETGNSSSECALITSHNIISISRNEPLPSARTATEQVFLTNCLCVGSSSHLASDDASETTDSDSGIAKNEYHTDNTSDPIMHGSRLADIKRQLGLQSEFFLNQHEIIRT